MKYFIDTEFIEGFHKPFLGKRRHFIDLISIGIVAEDGREYYAISDEFDESKASGWVKENVIDRLPSRVKKVIPVPDSFDFSKTVIELNDLYKPNKQIAKEIIEFVNPQYDKKYSPDDTIDNPWFIEKHGLIHYKPGELSGNTDHIWVTSPNFYGYYCDYDWVLLCSLFGTMMQLPAGFPMYCRDIKQMVDQWALQHCAVANISFDESLAELKKLPDYPKETDAHNALADARWNFELYKFITS